MMTMMKISRVFQRRTSRVLEWVLSPGRQRALSVFRQHCDAGWNTLCLNISIEKKRSSGCICNNPSGAEVASDSSSLVAPPLSLTPNSLEAMMMMMVMPMTTMALLCMQVAFPQSKGWAPSRDLWDKQLVNCTVPEVLKCAANTVGNISQIHNLTKISDFWATQL